MNTTEIALPIRPGEHACCRFARPEDRERLTIAFIRAGLTRGQKVIYLRDRDLNNGFLDRVRAVEERVDAALASGQLEVRPARDAYLAHGRFVAGEMRGLLGAEQKRALAEGFSGIAITGDVSVVYGEPGGDELRRYEEEFDRDPYDPSRLLLCHYPHPGVSSSQLSEVVAYHDIDASPELAPIGRDGAVSAARVRDGSSLRLAGELDFDGAPVVGEVLAAHFHGTLRLDLTDVSYVDVAGMRALRGRIGQRLTIAGASESVARMAQLLAWDTDPDVDLPAAA